MVGVRFVYALMSPEVTRGFHQVCYCCRLLVVRREGTKRAVRSTKASIVREVGGRAKPQWSIVRSLGKEKMGSVVH